MVRVSLSLLHKKALVQPSNILSNLATIGFKIETSLKPASKGKPKYSMGREALLDPRIPTKLEALMPPKYKPIKILEYWVSNWK